MPDFTFEGPGGRSITITGPEGATREQAIDILRQQHPELWSDGAAAKEEDSGGFLQDTGRFIRGAARGVTGVARSVAPVLNPALAAQDIFPAPAKDKLKIPTDPAKSFAQGGAKEGPEAWGKLGGEIGSTFIAPEFGLEAAAVRGAAAIPRLYGASRIAGATAEGAVGGTLGGATAPDSDVGGTATGAVTGAGLRGGGTALSLLPWRVRQGLNALAAAAATHGVGQLGLPSWAHLPVWWSLYRSHLADLAARWASRTPAAATGSAAAHVRESMDDDDDDTSRRRPLKFTVPGQP
jgi:hypothetical protein